MKILNLFILTALLVCCKSKGYKEYLKAKTEHDQRMALIQTFPDLYEDKVADSMKRWISIFKTVYVNDQKNRLVGYGFTEAGLKEQIILDSQNLIIVTSYLDTFGWPAAFDVGFTGQRAVGMTIQHAPLPIQEKYYPSLVKAYKRDSLLFETVAMLEDRINMRRKRYQYYGSQIVYYRGKPTFYPIYNVDSADVRRKKLNNRMLTLNEYIGIFKSDFKLTEYKSILPKLIDSFKVSNAPGLHFEIK